MNQTRLKKIGGAAFGALTVICLTFGTSAKACNVPGIGLKSGYLPDPSMFLSSLAPPSDNSIGCAMPLPCLRSEVGTAMARPASWGCGRSRMYPATP